MTVTRKAEERMSADEFAAWVKAQDGEARYELFCGDVIEMLGGRGQHSAAKSEVARQLFAQIPRGAPCRVHIDDIDVRVSDDTVFRPYLLIACGERLFDKTQISDPSLVIEVTSPSTSHIDLVSKTPLYLSLPSVVAVVVIDLRREMAVVSRGNMGDEFVSRIFRRDGKVEIELLSGFSVSLDLNEIFTEAAAA